MPDVWNSVKITQDVSILDAIKVIDSGGVQIALVVDGVGKLVGTVTDGDVRRGVLKGIDFNEPISKIMFTKPSVGKRDTTISQALAIMHRKQIHQLPIVDEQGKLIGLKLSETLYESRLENEVVLMAGGFGKRLNEMTESCPKPMLKVGKKPILETILENFVAAGFYKFTISLGYLGHMISGYFGDGSKWGAEINYITENEPLGTAGALSLLKQKPKLPFVVMNGDLLTQVDLKSLLQFHNNHNAIATMCVRGFEHSIPYGVVNIEEHIITGLEEKPIQSVLVNAGIYVLSPHCWNYIPKKKFFNMTTLFDKLIADGKKPIAFPIHEYWIDIGRKEDFDKASLEAKHG